MMARIGILGDLHLRKTKPVHRIDNYYQKQFEKLCYAYNTFDDYGCDFVIQPGDFFNNYGKDPYDVLYEAIALLALYRHIPLYLVFGQHDVKFHNMELKDVPAQILSQLDFITKLDKAAQPEKDDILLYGMNYGDPYIKKINRSRKKHKILVMHNLVLKTQKSWAKEYYSAKELAKDNRFDLIICGDNHEAFIQDNKVINCGSLMRMNLDQTNHKPMFVIYDTKTRKINKFHYPIDPIYIVFKKDIKKEDKQKEEQFREDFVISLANEDFEAGLDFRQNINTAMRKKRYRKRTKEIIEESLDAYQERIYG